MITVVLDGNAFDSLDSFFDEVERKLTRGLDFEFGRNLNAFVDVLRGGFGVHDYEEPLKLIWLNSEKSRMDLGWDETVRSWELALADCNPVNRDYFLKKLDAAKRKEGTTLFEDIVGMIRGEEHVKLELR